MALNTHSIDYERDSSQYSSIADASQTGLDLAGNCSFEVFLKIESLPSTYPGQMYMVSKGDIGAVANYGYFFNFLSNDKLNILYGSGGANFTSFESNSAAISSGELGTWIHYAATINAAGATGVLYKNGASIASTVTSNTATSIQNTSAAFQTNASLNGGSPTAYGDWKMNNLRIWSDIRTAAEIAANWKRVLTNTGVDNLVDSWFYNNNSNSASGLNNLTNVNSPVYTNDVPFTSGGLLYGAMV